MEEGQTIETHRMTERRHKTPRVNQAGSLFERQQEASYLDETMDMAAIHEAPGCRDYEVQYTQLVPELETYYLFIRSESLGGGYLRLHPRFHKQ